MDAPSATRPSLVDVEIDLSTGHGGPFVALATREPPANICRRLPQSAGFARGADRERGRGRLRGCREPRPRPGHPSRRRRRRRAAGRGRRRTHGRPLRLRRIPSSLSPATPLRCRRKRRTMVSARYGVDAAAFAEMQLRGFGSGLPAAGGGAAVTFSLRGIRLDPALVLGVSYLRSIWIGRSGRARQPQHGVGPNRRHRQRARLPGDLVAGRTDAGPRRRPGRCAGVHVRARSGDDADSGHDRVVLGSRGLGGGRRAPLDPRRRALHIFVAGGGDYQLREAGPRPCGRRAPTGAIGAPAQRMDEGPSGWRSSFLIGLAFTLAGRPLTTDYDATPICAGRVSGRQMRRTALQLRADPSP